MNNKIFGLARLAGCMLLVVSPLAVRADLTYETVDGTPLIYDSSDNTTWTQNGNISESTFTFTQAQTWVASLGSSLPGVSPDGWTLPNSAQFTSLFNQLAGSTDKYGSQVAFATVTGPNDYASNVAPEYWTVDSGTDFNFFYGYPGSKPDSNLYAAWAVEAAPEPAQVLMSLTVCGLLGGALRIRRHTIRA